mgnify:CR=1 FL=1
MEQNELYYFYVKPTKVNVTDLANQIGEKDYVVATTIECLIHQQNWVNKRRGNTSKHENAYANVSDKTLRNAHWRAPYAIRKLKDSGVLFCDDIYVVGEKALGYKFNHNLFDGTFDFWTVDINSVHHNAATSIQEYKSNSQVQVSETTQSLSKHIEDLNMSRDVLNDSRLSDTDLKPITDTLNGSRRFKQTGTANRIYSTVTSLPKYARSYISSNNYSDFSEVDLSCSQPFLFAGFVNSLIKARQTPHNHTEKCSTILSQGNSITTPEHIQSWVSGLSETEFENLKEELEEFIQLVTVQDIYMDAKDKLQPAYKNTLTRDNMKTKVLMLMNESHENLNSDIYEKDGQVYDNRLKYLETSYQSSFPVLWSILRKIRAFAKARFDTSAGDILNRLESHVMIGCATEISENTPYPVMTIHDCIMVPSEVASIVNQKVKNAFQSLFGIQPKTTVERLERQQPKNKVYSYEQKSNKPTGHSVHA